jgi:hypothetical protein
VADLSQAVAWHRQVAALVAAADRAGVATTELPAVRARLLLQQSRLTEEAARTGAALPALVPTASEIAAVGPALGDLSEPAVARTIRTMYSTLDAADSALSVPTPSPASTAASLAAMAVPGTTAAADVAGPSPTGVVTSTPTVTPRAGAWASTERTPTARIRDAADRSVALRNATVYGSFAATVLVVQIGLFVVLDETTLPLTGPLCLLVLPAFAWLAGYLTIGVAFRPAPGQRSVERTPRLGAIVCAVPDMLLFAGVVVLFAINTITN